MELKQLKVFLSVIETGSFTKSSRVLNYAQSTISDTVSKLEESLSVKLFIRDHRKLRLSDEGLILKGYADKIIRLAEEAKFSIQSTKRIINIGITESLCSYKFPAFFRSFIENHSNIGFRFNITRCEEIPELLSEGLIDIGFTIDEATEYKTLNTIYLFDEPIVFVVGHNHPRIDKILKGHIDSESIMISEGQTGYNILLSEAYQRNKISLGPTVYMESIEGIKSFVKDGFGITFIPKVTVESELESGLLVEFNIENRTYNHQVSILTHKKKQDDLLDLLIEAAKDTYQVLWD